ncbi:hypothetical protein HPP92_003050 [Vanilla planifolia]|uniref:Uncharacterized protein n=1 Tax=Vanilla planifolia TaxID=51239 RepID=A0A835RZ95_VANPL|nr:hypothetical protein HPP92_003050 [Vanilla planifolia]
MDIAMTSSLARRLLPARQPTEDDREERDDCQTNRRRTSRDARVGEITSDSGRLERPS